MGIAASAHTPVRMAPAAARLSMGLEKSRHAGCLPILAAQKSTMPPVVEPMVIGRQSALPAIARP